MPTAKIANSFQSIYGEATWLLRHFVLLLLLLLSRHENPIGVVFGGLKYLDLEWPCYIFKSEGAAERGREDICPT